jgi:hypothetical protein
MIIGCMVTPVISTRMAFASNPEAGCSTDFRWIYSVLADEYGRLQQLLPQLYIKS